MSSQVITGDCLESLRRLPDESVHCCVTSPPYFGLRDYGVDGQFGLESSPEEYVSKAVDIFREVRRVLRNDGTLWLNLGDSYARGFGGGSPGVKSASNLGSFKDRKPGKVPDGLKSKDLIGIPWTTAFALRDDGWYLRQDIIWHKPNAMPESVKDRCTKSHEYIFLMSKSERYYFSNIREPFTYPTRKYNPDTSAHKTADLKKQGNRSTSGLHDGRTQYGDPELGRNKRSVWSITTKPFRGAHFATFPPDLVENCLLGGCPEDGTVLDPFCGSGTTGVVAAKLGRSFIGLELNPEYAEMSRKRIAEVVPSSEVHQQEADWLSEMNA